MIGQQRYIAYNSASYESPTWVAISLAKDVKIPMTRNEADASYRGYGGYAAVKGGLISLSFEFNMREDRASTVHDALQNAFLNGTTLDLWATDSDPTEAGAEGPRATCEIVGFSTNETLSDEVTIDVVAKPAPSTHVPEWFAP